MAKMEYIPEPTAERMHLDDSFVRGIMGPIGSGKSVACCMEMIMRAQEQLPNASGIRKSRWAVVRNTYPQLKSTTIKTWQAWVPDHIAPITYDSPIRCLYQRKLEDDTRMEMELLFLSLDRPDHVSKLLSLDLTGAWINEAREVPKAILDGLTGRVDRFPSKADGGVTWCGVLMDTNPPDTDHWWYRLAEEETPVGWRFFRQPPALIYNEGTGTWMPNPSAENIQNLNSGYDYYTRLLAGKNREWCRVYVEGSYGTVMEGKPVYPEYNDDVHSAPSLRVFANMPIILGVDFGLTPAVVCCQASPRGQLRVLSEIVSTDSGIRQLIRDELIPHLNAKYPGLPARMVCDPAGAQRAQTDARSCFDELSSAGFSPIPAPTNAFLPRREAVAGFLLKMIDGEPGFILSQEGCPQLRRGFLGGYKFRRVNSGGGEKFTDVPDKNAFSHPADALQYAALEAQGVKPEVHEPVAARRIVRSRVQVAI